MTRHGLSAAGVADAGAFLSRLHRLDPAALVRLRPTPTRVRPSPTPPGSPGGTPASVPGEYAAVRAAGVALWARLPWGVLVTRTVDGTLAEDATVAAAALLDVLAAGGAVLPPRRDSGWRWPLPPTPGTVVESVPADTVRALGAAAERALRAAAAGETQAGRVLGERAVRDALLDHVPIVVETAIEERAAEPAGPARPAAVQRIAVPQRLVQAVVRMGFLGGPEVPVEVLVATGLTGRFVGLAAEYGIAWYQQAAGLSIKAIV